MRRKLPFAALAFWLVLACGGGGAWRTSLAAVEDHSPRAAASEAAHAEAEPEPLKPEPDLGVWTLIIFVVLLAVLYKFAWGPLLGALEKREHNLKQALDEAERNRADAVRLLDEHRQRLDRAQDEVRGLIEQARRDAQKLHDEMLRQAQAESEATRERAKKDIEQARDQALGEIYSQTARLATGVAARVLAKSLTPEDHQRLLDQAVAELPAHGNGTGSRATS